MGHALPTAHDLALAKFLLELLLRCLSNPAYHYVHRNSHPSHVRRGPSPGHVHGQAPVSYVLCFANSLMVAFCGWHALPLQPGNPSPHSGRAGTAAAWPAAAMQVSLGSAGPACRGAGKLAGGADELQGRQAGLRAGRRASRKAGKLAGRQASFKEGRQACRQAGELLARQASLLVALRTSKGWHTSRENKA